MGLMKLYDNKEISFNGCPGCSYAKHEFELSCGMCYESLNFILSQDWELPIPGFLIVSPKKHIEKLEELSNIERDEMFEIVNKAIIILRNNEICDRFDVIFEEKNNRHLHVWIMPRYEWMDKITDDIIDEVGVILNYAKENFRTKENFENIKNVVELVKKELDIDS